jgi:hypothetical protein
MEFVGAAEREECARACLRAGVGAELDAEAEDEDVEVDLEDKLVLLSDEAMYLLEVVDLLLRRSGRGRDAGEGAGVGRNGFDAVVCLAAGTGLCEKNREMHCVQGFPRLSLWQGLYA